MAGEDFMKIGVWQKSQALAAEVVALVSALPRDRSAEIIGAQLLRAASSVAANIAEGYGRYSQASYRSHLSIARGSLFETKSWIDLLARSGFLSSDTATSLNEKCDEVGRLITFRMKSLGSARQTYAREERARYDSE